MPNLKIRERGKEVFRQIEGDVVTIGRGETNTIAIEDAKASKEHCRIELVGDRWRMVDLESKNGTKVNGEFRNKAWLDHGDTVQIGTAEIELGLEGAARVAAPTATPPARAAGSRAATARAATRRPAREEDDYEDEGPPPPRRYGGSSSSDKMLIASLVVLGIVVIVFVASRVVGQLDSDPYNRQVLGAAEELMAQGRWTDAQEYLIKNADPDGNFYPEIQKRIRELQLRTPDYHQQQNELAARKLHTRLGLKIRSYDRGGMGTRPEDILKIVERMKTEFAATEQTRLAKEEYPAWFAGKVPQRASEYLASGGQLKKDWEQALADSKEWEKDWRFREAREAIERFISVREAVLAADELDYYRGKADQQLSRLDLSADGIYRAQERRSWDLLKNRRYDEAILLFKAVIEKFGLDAYVRKAQAEIRKIEEQKKHPSGS